MSENCLPKNMKSSGRKKGIILKISRRQAARVGLPIHFIGKKFRMPTHIFLRQSSLSTNIIGGRHHVISRIKHRQI